jgi:hypothetical protein
MDVDRRIGRQGVHEFLQRSRVHRSQGMRRGADADVRTADTPEAFDQLQDEGGIGIEAPLARLQGLLSEIRPAVERGQERDGDAAVFRRFQVALEEVGGAVVHVVELAHGGVAVSQHVDVKLRGDRARLRRREARNEAVHQLAPGPEIVLAGPLRFREARHRALEGVRVQVRHAGQRGARQHLRSVGAGIRLDRSESTGSINVHADIPRPTLRQERIGREIRGHAAMIAACTTPPG